MGLAQAQAILRQQRISEPICKAAPAGALERNTLRLAVCRYVK